MASATQKRQSFRSALGSCYKSAFDCDIDQLALDVDFLGNGLAGDGFGHGGLGLGGSNGIRALDGGGHLDAGLDLAVDLHRDLDGLLHALGFVVGRPG